MVQGFADPATGPAPLEVQFSSTAADPDGDPLIYRWTFGDGGSALRSNPVHTYTKPGSYTATVTVRDPDGNVGTDTVQITVNAPGNQIPMVVTAADPTEGNAPLPVRFQAQAIDPDGPRTSSSTAGTSATAARCSAATSGTRTWSRAPTRPR